MSTSNILLAHDSFTQMGGAERVFEGMSEAFPEAEVFVLVCDKKYKGYTARFKKVHTSVLQPLYNLFPRFKYFLPLIPAALHLERSSKQADILLSSTSLFLKALPKKKNAVHIQYCHTPPRFLWIDRDYSQKEIPTILKPIAYPFLYWLRYWDKKQSAKVDCFIANSHEVQKRIKTVYGRDSQLIHPFINTSFWKPTTPKQDYFLAAGRLVSHKRYELVIEVCNELGIPLKVVGEGRLKSKLQSMANPNISFVGRVTDEELRDLYSSARGLIFPQKEDFGLMPLEAAACGTPTIASKEAGSLETVVENTTGILLDDINHDTLKHAILSFDSKRFTAESLVSHAQQFSKDTFIHNLTEIVHAHTR